MDNYRVMIVDDHALMRQGLKMILATDPKIEVASEVSNGEEALELLHGEQYDVVLLDISLPGRSGLDVLRHIKARYKHLPVLILSMHPEDQYALRALKAGAAGYMTKESAPEELVKAVCKVAEGGRYVSPSLAERLVLELEQPGSDLPHTLLSDREFEVFRLIGAGNTPSDIAECLNLSVKTVSTYRSRILEKMQLRTNTDIIRYAVRHGLVD